MRAVEFRRLLDYDNALRVMFESERGQILRFVVQLECQFVEDGKWTPVVRYDTAHGYAHRDIMHRHTLVFSDCFQDDLCFLNSG